MNLHSLSQIIVILGMTAHIQAGEAVVSSKNPAPVPLNPAYEGGRGLLTIQRPSGLFINPTSGTMPQGAFTAQYCFFLPDNDNSPYMTHGAMVSYGVTDWLELGGIFTARDNDYASNQFSGGPMLRARLLKAEGWMPEVSIGGYASFGDQENYNAFLALFKRIEIDPNGILRSVGLHAGIRETWVRQGPLLPNNPTVHKKDISDAPVGYFGLEIQLPLRLYLVGEVSTTDEDVGNATPYGFGLQWRYGGINITTAFANPGNTTEPSFFFGIGTQLKF